MSAPLLLGIALLGGAGAVARWRLDAAITARAGAAFPWGTLAVNLTGAFGLGVVSGLAPGEDATRLLAGGLLGAYTTWSTLALQAERHAREGARRVAFAYVIASLVLGLACVWAGRELGGVL